MVNITDLNLNVQPKKEKHIFKVHAFFFFMMAWSIGLQFAPLPENTYQPLAIFLPCVVYFIFDKQAFKRILAKYKLLKFRAILIIPLIWICMFPLKITIISTYDFLFGNELSTMVSSNTVSNPWILILLTAVTPAVFEELIMRGIVLDGYRNKKIHIAAIMNGLIFGMMHLNTFQFVHTFISGIVMTYLVYITGSIFSSMLLHFINNSAPQWISILSGSAESNTVESASASNAASAITPSTLIIMAIFALIGVFITIKLFKKLCKVYNVNIKEDNKTKDFSHEKVINLPFIGVITLFIGFSLFIILRIKGII